jgi:hypothetical protein
VVHRAGGEYAHIPTTGTDKNVSRCGTISSARKYPESSPLRKTIARGSELPGIKGESPELPSSVSDLRLSGCDINSDHFQVFAGGFESLLGFMVRNKSGVIIKCHIPFPAQAVKDDQQTLAARDLQSIWFKRSPLTKYRADVIAGT